MSESLAWEIERLPTGIPGFDQVCSGGLPKNRSAIVAGTAGSGKTLMAMQFLHAGVKYFDEGGVFVTFEESPADLILNVKSFGWDIDELIRKKKIAVVDATPDPGENNIQAGAFDLAGLMARIENAARSVKAKRVILDAVGALFPQFSDSNLVRRELHRIAAGLRRLNLTIVMTMERLDEEGGIGRFGVEEYVADNVIILRNRLEQERRRRTIEILKFRGVVHQKGEYTFTIDRLDGITILPLSAIELKQGSTNKRVSSGIPELDGMCGGGMYRDSIILISGATGTGKTLTVTHYIKAAIEAGERAILFGSEESREQLTRNARSWGIDFEGAEKTGLLRIICRYPDVMGLEDHLLQMRRDIDDFKPARVAVDSLSAFELAGSRRSFREFVITLTSHLKHKEITGLITNTTPMLIGGESVTESHISTITDTIILLRYVELHGEMRRGLAILKMRGTQHQKDIREYLIDGEGMHIRDAFRGVHGIMTGTPTYMFTREREQLSDMFTAKPLSLDE
ncbi:circadian clock protein KaiC [Mangrovibrevibacter kandeliae]|uniref:circadian clock protein KaiC n=1 Tax=Mangrovibrevibacter kandeliae TaxID=2968473 RepID=UPI002117CF3B|nr:circadian clock protein KaiC [Aurantimonas sp. CSK15Z-1]MCQ8782960.1 circadian clock protein KaiC [Aurantimonas sp. CSK15Z-1]